MTALREGFFDERDDELQETLEELAARIRASGEGQTLPRPSQEAIDRFAAEVDNETPLTPEQEAEWNRTWAATLRNIRFEEARKYADQNQGE